MITSKKNEKGNWTIFPFTKGSSLGRLTGVSFNTFGNSYSFNRQFHRLYGRSCYLASDYLFFWEVNDKKLKVFKEIL